MNETIYHQMVANVSGCSLGNPEKIGDCLRNLDNDIIEEFGKVGCFIKLNLLPNLDNFLLITPVDVFFLRFHFFFSLQELFLNFPININGHFLKKPMIELYRKHELLTVPFMTGINNHEGGFLLSDVSAESRSHLFIFS